MWRTTELRWWWRGAPDQELSAWLLRGVSPIRDFRTDLYLDDPAQTDIGVKRRALETVEIKMLCGLPEIALPAAMEGQAEIWVKGTSERLPLTDENSIAVGKQRRRRILGYEAGAWKEASSEDEVDAGMSAEITEVDITGETWTTVALEAFGAEEGNDAVLQAGVTLLGSWP
ncbi:MAG: hypothetical protein WA979_02985, partial [Pacificimonas sp.]